MDICVSELLEENNRQLYYLNMEDEINECVGNPSVFQSVIECEFIRDWACGNGFEEFGLELDELINIVVEPAADNSESKFSEPFRCSIPLWRGVNSLLVGGSCRVDVDGVERVGEVANGIICGSELDFVVGCFQIYSELVSIGIHDFDFRNEPGITKYFDSKNINDWVVYWCLLATYHRRVCNQKLQDYSIYQSC